MLVQNILTHSKKSRQNKIRVVVCSLLLLAAGALSAADAAAQTNAKRRTKPAGIFPNPQTRAKKRAPQSAAAKPAENRAAAPVKTGENSNPNDLKNAPSSNQTLDRRQPRAVPNIPNNKSDARSKEPLFQQVGDVIRDLEKDGFSKKHDFIAEKMRDDKSWSNTVSVERSKRYVLLALCDDQCPAMNLRVYDDTGKLILNHRERQSRPTVFFTPQRTGIYRFKTTVVTCKKELCRAALSVYER